MDQHQSPPINETLSYLILLSHRISLAVDDSNSYKLDCADVAERVDRLSQMLRSAARFVNSTSFLYERPVRRIFTDVAKTLIRTLNLVRKCRRRSIFGRFISILGAADFRKVFNLLDASIGDMKWLLRIFDGGGTGGGIVYSLPPIANNDPMLAWVWSHIASLYLCSLNVKVEVAYELSLLACDNDRNKEIIVEEGGVSSLLKLLKDDSLPEAQIAGANTLFNLANDQSRARSIFNEHGVPIIAQVFRNSPIIVQSEVAKLIARMAEHDGLSQEGFERENLIGALITSLSFDILMDDDLGKVNKLLKQKFDSTIVDVGTNDQKERVPIMSSAYRNKSALPFYVCSRNRRESKNSSPQLILEFKTNCSGALWMLVKGNAANSKKLTETKGLLCLAKLIERENGELQINCLMTVMEVTAAAESNPDIRRTAFKTNSPAAKAIIDQLLKLINQSDNPVIKIPAIRAIGDLARTFPARQTQIIGPLVKQVSHQNPDVARESVIALGKFTCPENFLCAEHSKTIVEFEGIVPLMRLLRESERTQYHALVLLCYVAMHAGNNEQFQKARVLTALEGADKSVACRYSELRELVAKAIYHLSVSHDGLVLYQRQPYVH